MTYRRTIPGLLILLAMIATPVLAQDAPFFEMEDLFVNKRIPKVTVATDGTVLALADSGRLLRRSEDGGKTWSEAIPLGETAGGGSLIVDSVTGDVMSVDPKKGRLWRILP